MVMTKRKKKIRKIFTLGILFCFSATNIWAMPEPGLILLPQKETPAFLQVEIPKDIASIEEVYEAPPKSDPRLVLHVQNIHGNYEAQMQIKKLLDYLYKRYAFKLLFVEGAVDTLDPAYLKLFSEEDRNQKLADYLAKRGELTGIETYMMEAPRDVRAVGIEEPALYRKNLEAYKAVMSKREETDKFLRRYEEKLELLSSRNFSPETRRLISEWKKFQDGQRDFLPYVRRLSQDARKIIGLDLESLFAQVEWPQMTRLLVLQSMEAELNLESAQDEKQKVLSFLKEKKISSEILTAIEKLGEKRITMTRENSEAARLEDLPRYLLERLVDEASPRGFYFHDYPAFSLWAGYLILQSELDSRTLFDEIERVFEKTLDQLTVTQGEKNLMELYRDERLLNKLLHLELTRKEWEKVSYRKEWNHPSAMLNRLKKIGQEFDSRLKRTPETLVPKQEVTGMEESPESEEFPMNGLFETAVSFYDFAREREAVFMNTIKKEMSAQKTEKAVLVTGGFHTQGILEMFRDDEINYSVLMPRIAGSDLSTDNYVTNMLEDRKTMFDIAGLEAIIKLQNADRRTQQGADAAYEVKRTLEAYAKFTGSETLAQLVNHFNVFNQSAFSVGYKVTLETVLNQDNQPYGVRILVNGQPLKKNDSDKRDIVIPIMTGKNPETKLPEFRLADHAVLRIGESVTSRSEVRGVSEAEKAQFEAMLGRLRGLGEGYLAALQTGITQVIQAGEGGVFDWATSDSGHKAYRELFGTNTGTVNYGKFENAAARQLASTIAGFILQSGLKPRSSADQQELLGILTQYGKEQETAGEKPSSVKPQAGAWNAEMTARFPAFTVSVDEIEVPEAPVIAGRRVEGFMRGLPEAGEFQRAYGALVGARDWLEEAGQLEGGELFSQWAQAVGLVREILWIISYRTEGQRSALPALLNQAIDETVDLNGSELAFRESGLKKLEHLRQALMQNFNWPVPSFISKSFLIKAEDAAARTERMIISPNGKYAVKVGRDPGISVLRVGNYGEEFTEVVDSVSQSGRRVLGAAFDSDGGYLATSGVDPKLNLWSVAEDGKLTLIFQEDVNDVTSAIAFSPDNRYLVSIGLNQGLNLWRVENRSLRKVLTWRPQDLSRWPVGLIRSVAFLPGGQVEIVGGQNASSGSRGLDAFVYNLFPVAPQARSEARVYEERDPRLDFRKGEYYLHENFGLVRLEDFEYTVKNGVPEIASDKIKVLPLGASQTNTAIIKNSSKRSGYVETSQNPITLTITKETMKAGSFVPYYKQDQNSKLRVTDAAKALTEKRLQALGYSKSSALVPILFGFDVIAKRIQSEKKSGVTDGYFSRVYEQIKTEVPEGAMDYPWDVLKSQSLTAEQIKFFKTLFLRIYQEQGEDVILTGLLDSFKRESENYMDTWAFTTSTGNDFVENKTSNLIGAGSRGDQWSPLRTIPKDIDRYYRGNLLKGLLFLNSETETLISEEDYQKIQDRFNLYLRPYYSRKNPLHGSDAFSQLMLTFKDAIRDGDFTAVNELLKIVGPDIVRLKSRLSGKYLVVPAPSPDFFKNQTVPLAAIIARELDFPASLFALSKSGQRKKPQKLQPDLWHRVENAGKSFLEADPEIVSGKEILVVDDIVTSGFTLDAAREALYAAGAKKVLTLAYGRTTYGKDENTADENTPVDEDEAEPAETEDESVAEAQGSILAGWPSEIMLLKPSEEAVAQGALSRTMVDRLFEILSPGLIDGMDQDEKNRWGQIIIWILRQPQLGFTDSQPDVERKAVGLRILMNLNYRGPGLLELIKDEIDFSAPGRTVRAKVFSGVMELAGNLPPESAVDLLPGLSSFLDLAPQRVLNNLTFGGVKIPMLAVMRIQIIIEKAEESLTPEALVKVKPALSTVKTALTAYLGSGRLKKDEKALINNVLQSLSRSEARDDGRQARSEVRFTQPTEGAEKITEPGGVPGIPERFNGVQFPSGSELSRWFMTVEPKLPVKVRVPFLSGGFVAYAEEPADMGEVAVLGDLVVRETTPESARQISRIAAELDVPSVPMALLSVISNEPDLEALAVAAVLNPKAYSAVVYILPDGKSEAEARDLQKKYEDQTKEIEALRTGGKAVGKRFRLIVTSKANAMGRISEAERYLFANMKDSVNASSAGEMMEKYGVQLVVGPNLLDLSLLERPRVSRLVRLELASGAPDAGAISGTAMVVAAKMGLAKEIDPKTAQLIDNREQGDKVITLSLNKLRAWEQKLRSEIRATLSFAKAA